LPSSLVLDSGAFYSGIAFLSSSVSTFYITEAVFDEVRHIKSSYAALQALLESGKLQIFEPGKPYMDKVAAIARKTGDNMMLSAADLSIIALALQLKIPLVTDDYAASNVASVLGIPVEPASSGKGIKETRRWINYCSACGRTFGPDSKECPLCGNKLKRKYRKVT